MGALFREKYLFLSSQYNVLHTYCIIYNVQFLYEIWKIDSEPLQWLIFWAKMVNQIDFFLTIVKLLT